ncbi:MAG: NAD(P)-dependent oxidoreductase [Acidobacteriota bacterium]
MKVGFIGTGSMGRPMAENLLKAGHEVNVFNRTGAKAKLLEALGAKIAESPAGAAESAQVLVTMLSDDPAVETVLGGETGALQALSKGSVHLSMSTLSPAFARALEAEHAARGVDYVAAPVFGRPEAAASASLWVIAAGKTAAVERVRPIFEAVGQGAVVVGEEPFKANVVKLAGNFLLASAIEAMGEAFALARRSGVSASTMLEIANGCLFKSPIYQNYGNLIAGEKYEPAGFRLRWGLKDMRYVRGEAAERAVPMEFADVVHAHYLTGLARGLGDIDWAGLGKIVAQNAGLEPAG